jgi:hypothetical protein
MPSFWPLKQPLAKLLRSVALVLSGIGLDGDRVSSGRAVVSFVAYEPFLFVRLDMGEKMRGTLRPDSELLLLTRAGLVDLLLEWDRGTETQERLREKLRRYRTAEHKIDYDERGPRSVLFVVAAAGGCTRSTTYADVNRDGDWPSSPPPRPSCTGRDRWHRSGSASTSTTRRARADTAATPNVSNAVPDRVHTPDANAVDQSTRAPNADAADVRPPGSADGLAAMRRRLRKRSARTSPQPAPPAARGGRRRTCVRPRSMASWTTATTTTSTTRRGHDDNQGLHLHAPAGCSTASPGPSSRDSSPR